MDPRNRILVKRRSYVDEQIYHRNDDTISNEESCTASLPKEHEECAVVAHPKELVSHRDDRE